MIFEERRDFSKRLPAESPEAFLTAKVADAIETCRRIAPALLDIWQDRRLEVGSGVVVNAGTSDWLEFLLGQHTRDRELAEYLRRLRGTFLVAARS